MGDSFFSYCILLLFVANSKVWGLSPNGLSAKSPCAKILSAPPPKLTEAEHWRATGLSYSHIISYELISERQCRKNQTDFLICLTALNALGKEGRSQYMLMPQSLFDRYSDEVAAVEKNYGPLLLVRLKENLPDLRGDTEEESFAYFRKRDNEYRQAIKEVYRTSSTKLLPILADLIERIRDPQTEAAQVAAAFNAAFLLDDPHAYLVPASLLEERESSAGMDDLVGVGMVLKSVGQIYSVGRVVDGGPAEKAGLHTGDVLLAIDGVSLENKNIQSVLSMVEGKDGTLVRFSVKRNNQMLTIEAIRRRLVLKNVEHELIENSVKEPVGYIYLRSFANESACKDVKTSLEKLLALGAKKFIFDLRDNKGGLLKQGACIAGLFVGKKLVANKVFEDEEPMPVHGKHAQVTKLPLVVLINGESASASELVAGALRDDHRAWIMGVTSFGKGTVQHAFPYDDESKILQFRTLETFYQPSGSSNQIVGIQPNFTVFQTPHLQKEEFVAREKDLFPNAWPGSKKTWKEDRTADVRSLNKCMDASGQATAKWEALIEKGANADYQKLRAVDLLNCL